MSPEKQRISIAEVCGIFVCQTCWHELDPELCYCGDYLKGHTQEHGAVPRGCTCGYADADKQKATEPESPNYPGDLNACHEMEEALTDDQGILYGSILAHIRTRFTESKWMWHATAPQRCEAFLKTIGKWEGEK